MYKKSNVGTILKFSSVKMPLFLLFSSLILLGVLISIYGLPSLYGVIGFLFIIFLFWKSYLALPFVILIMIDCFGFFNPETFLHVKDLFKLRDVLFVALLTVFFFRVLIRDPSFFVKKTPINGIILSIVGLTIFEIFYTVWLYDIPLISAIQAGREYLFYLIFFPVLYFLSKKKNLFFCIKVFLIFAIIGALLTIEATVFGQNSILPSYLHTRLAVQNLSEFRVNRLYLPSASIISIAYSILFWVIVMNRKLQHRGLLIVITIILGVAWFFSFSRAEWLCMFIAMTFPVFFIRKTKIKRLKIAGAYLFIVILFMTLTSLISNLDIFSGGKFIFDRIISIGKEIKHQEGTFGYRMAESEFRFKALKEHFLLGCGFLHPKLVPRFYKIPEMILNRPERYALGSGMVDWGLPTLLIIFGIPGLLWFVAMVITVHKRIRKILNELNSPIEKSIVVGALSYFWGAVASFLTAPRFTFFQNIILFVVLWAVVEAIYYQSKLDYKRS